MHVSRQDPRGIDERMLDKIAGMGGESDDTNNLDNQLSDSGSSSGFASGSDSGSGSGTFSEWL